MSEYHRMEEKFHKNLKESNQDILELVHKLVLLNNNI